MKEASLRHHLKILSVKWAIAAFVLCGAISVGFASFATRKAEELRIRTIARSVARAYRPLLLNNLIRDAQAQMKNALALSTEESVLVRGKNLEILYSPDGAEHLSTCRSIEHVCWNGAKMTYVQPVYFDGDARTEVFGFVDLTLVSEGAMPAAWILFSILGGLFLIFVFGLLASVTRVSTVVDRTLQEWSGAIRAAIRGDSREILVPYQEFADVGKLIGRLHGEVERLRFESAAEAHIKGQLSVLRGIGHDLKTPFSQLRKYFEVLLLRFGRTGQLDTKAVSQIRKSSDRVTLLLNEIRHATQPDVENYGDEPAVDLSFEATAYLETLKGDPEFGHSGVTLESHLPLGTYFGKVSRIQFYRVFDNLMKNALDAVRPGGSVSVTVGRFGGLPMILVVDDGEGISTVNMARIFSADFTTKSDRGTGLGLSVVQKICFDIGAKVSVQSEVEKGSSFCIQFQEAIVSSEVDGPEPIVGVL